MVVEICTYGLDDALRAQAAGADRIELCSGRAESGISPSLGLIEVCLSQLSIPIAVMLRPRGGDFTVSKTEFETLKSDLRWYKKIGVSQVVVGILDHGGKTAKAQLAELIAIHPEANFTFHRAIDVAVDPLQTLEDCIDLGFTRILTSGCQPKAINGLEMLKAMTNSANGKIEMMAGSGINSNNFEMFLDIGLDAIHFSAARIIGQSPSNAVSEENPVYQTDLKEIETVVSAIRNRKTA